MSWSHTPQQSFILINPKTHMVNLVGYLGIFTGAVVGSTAIINTLYFPMAKLWVWRRRDLNDPKEIENACRYAKREVDTANNIDKIISYLPLRVYKRFLKQNCPSYS